MPEMATFVKFKVLEPEAVESFIKSINLNKDDKSDSEYYFQYRKTIIENFIFNLKGEVSESLRLMSRNSAEACLDAIYTRMHNVKPRVGC